MSEPKRLSGMQAAGAGGGGSDKPPSDRPTLPPLAEEPLSLDERKELSETAPLLSRVFEEFRRMPIQFAAEVAKRDERRDAEAITREREREVVQQKRERVRDDTINKSLNQVSRAIGDMQLNQDMMQNEVRKTLVSVTELRGEVLKLTERVDNLERTGRQRDAAIERLKEVDDETLHKLNNLAERVETIALLLADKKTQ